MNKEFIPYEQALALKELGFDEPCFAWYVSEKHGLEYGKVIQSDQRLFVPDRAHPAAQDHHVPARLLHPAGEKH